MSLMLFLFDMVNRAVREIEGIDDAKRFVSEWESNFAIAGFHWWIVPATMADEALRRGAQLKSGRHPLQPEYDIVHAEIRAGLLPSLEPLMENVPCPLPRPSPFWAVPR